MGSFGDTRHWVLDDGTVTLLAKNCAIMCKRLWPDDFPTTESF